LSAIHQFLPVFAGGDAIGNHVLRLQRVLRAAGLESEIYADEIRPAVRRHARPYREFRGAGSDWMLYHLSTGSPMAAFLAEQEQPLAVYYHNITPAPFFAAWEPEATENVTRAREELRKLASVTRFAMANSSYSEAELRDEGYADTCVVPVLVDFADYDGIPDRATTARLARAKERGGTRWLFVGRLAPNKCQHDVIGAFAVYRTLFDPDARLCLVGGKTSALYHRALERLVDELGVASAVELADAVSGPELLAQYRGADVFVSLSEHEGFLVPVVEAMHFGVPLVVRGTSAVPETVGDAGLVLPAGPEGRDPVVVATAVRRVVTDTGLRERLVAAGRERAGRFSLVETGRRFVEVFRAHGC
jgi:L-malate glycosyltransferase